MIKFLDAGIAKRYRGTTCLLRVDLNVEPGAEDATNRVDAAIPTIRLLLKHNIRVVILSHRGRPTRRDAKFSLKPFAGILAKKLSVPVRFVPGTNLVAVRAHIAGAREAVVLLENLRFFSGETANDESFARHLAALGTFFVNEAFAVSHRKNASVVALAKRLPAYGGLWMKEELGHLTRAMVRPARPFVLVVGGAKVADKLVFLKKMVRRADFVLLGSSVFGRARLPDLPNLVWPDDLKEHAGNAWDIGPLTAKRYAAIVRTARTVVWNGPVGFSEKKGFEEGTRAIWNALMRNRSARIVIGGGETVASRKALRITGTISKRTFVSTGGGAMLAYLSGEKLPGIEALKH